MTNEKRDARTRRQMAREIVCRFRAQARHARRARCRQRQRKSERLAAAILASELRKLERLRAGIASAAVNRAASLPPPWIDN